MLENPREDRVSLQPAAAADGLHFKIGAAARFRRSGSRVLSVLGLRSNRGILTHECSGVYVADSLQTAELVVVPPPPQASEMWLLHLSERLPRPLLHPLL